MPRNVSVQGAFQLTPSVGRATVRCKNLILGQQISIHALHGEGDHGIVAACITDDISIHALREEGDAKICMRFSLPTNFNPRPPRGGRPNYIEYVLLKHLISIHALREEGDPAPPGSTPSQTNFNPRPPRGERPSSLFCQLSTSAGFQSTPSARRATG